MSQPGRLEEKIETRFVVGDIGESLARSEPSACAKCGVMRRLKPS